jgi:hypothetical protein
MWMELGNTMSSEICRHRKTSTIWSHLYRNTKKLINFL